MPRTPIVALSIGDPAITLEITSPGDFPPGVDGVRLLAARSEPRNRALADAMRLLGYAEREGNGIPTMFRVLLRDGHPEPEIYSEGGHIICRLPGRPSRQCSASVLRPALRPRQRSRGERQRPTSL